MLSCHDAPSPCAASLHWLIPCVLCCQDPPDMLQHFSQPFSAFILMAGESHTIFSAPITLASGHGNISISTNQPHPLSKLRKATKCPIECLSPRTNACMEDLSPQEGTAMAAPFTVQNNNPSTSCTHRHVRSHWGDPRSADRPNVPASQLQELDVQCSRSTKVPRAHQQPNSANTKRAPVRPPSLRGTVFRH